MTPRSATKITLDAIEVHAEGEPGRILTSAAGLVQGDTMAERLQYCKENLDWLRRLMLHEPRGYPGLCSVILLPAVNEGSDFGIVVLEQGGFTPMSGSNTICAVTAALEEGIVPVRGPETVVTIDTAVGVVQAVAKVHEGKVLSVTVVNVPAFVVELDHPLEVPGFGTVPVDVVFGGQFFAQAKAADLGLELHPDNGRELARAGALIKMAAAEQIQCTHPDNPLISGVNLVMLHTGDRVPGRQDRNTVVLSNGKLVPSDPSTWTGALDRSPCGTGTSARMAALHARGQLAIGENFSHHSIIGSEFIGRLTGTTRTARGREAVLPTVTGRGWVTGRSQWVLEPTDPFPTGYTVGDIWAPGA
ncbi:proline racemase family protein [Pseudarthrobacter sp. NS4]|uniref:proline racemase family protein n=1 Tax=Pseudarthrobacter sp. NS4 TaxID=2973976 RepID=UPI002162663B|nr:proline racemase family protein [Pseudarthrobacter sp. NS4]